MANTSSILYQAGQAVKNKIATELANASSGANGYTQNIGDNSVTTINVTHNLNSDNIIYSLRDISTNEYVHTQTERIDSNTIKFVFDTAPTTNQYLATIISTDGSSGGSTCASSPATITVSSDTSGGLYTTSDSSGNGDLFGCINAYRGQTLTIDVEGNSADLQSYPLQITNYNDLGQGMSPLSGVQKTQYGNEYTLTWTVPCDETVTKYQYQCSSHAGMRGTINVLGSCGDNTTNIESYLGSLPTLPTMGGGLSLNSTTGGLVWKGTSGITVSRVSGGKFRLTFPTAYSAVSDYHVMASYQDGVSPTQDITVGTERATTHVDFYTLRSSDGNNIEQGDLTILIYEFS